MRLERLAPTVLLALFAGLIQRVELTEPAQHLHFGVISASGLQVWLRWIDQANPGGQVTATQGGQVTPTQGTVTLRQDSARAVVDVTTTVAALSADLTAAYAPLGQALPRFEAAAFSLQLIQAPIAQAFTTAAGEAAPASGAERSAQ